MIFFGDWGPFGTVLFCSVDQIIEIFSFGHHALNPEALTPKHLNPRLNPKTLNPTPDAKALRERPEGLTLTKR